MKHDEYHRQFADRVIEQIRQGTAPWQKPWGPGERVLPANVDTGRSYSGGNSLHLAAVAQSRGYGDVRWGTYRQIQARGGQVRKGEQGTRILSFQDHRKIAVNDERGRPKRDNEGKRVYRHERLPTPYVRQYTVFNAEQADGLPARPTPTAEPLWKVHQNAERVLEDSGVPVRHMAGDRAFYNLNRDEIVLPATVARRGIPGQHHLDLEETVPGLTNVREYAFEVRAVNSAGPGAPARTAATPLGMPSVPESLTATGGDGEVVLEWTEPADDGGSPVTGYGYRYAAGQAVPEDVTWRDAGTELTATVSGLENETRYTFEVRARNRVGPGETSGTTALPLRLRAELFSSAAAAEGEALVVGVRRSGRLAFPAHAYIGVTDSALPGVTATEEGRDDGLGRHRLEFAAGAAEATVTVTVVFDGERRQDRVLSATLDSAELEVDGVRRPYELVTPTLVVPVTEGDAGLSVADARVQGKSSVLAFTVSLDRTRDVAVRVDYATEDGSARAGEDYTPVSGTLTIAAGGRERTVEMPVLPALHVTGERTLTLRLSHAVSAVIDGRDRSRIGAAQGVAGAVRADGVGPRGAGDREAPRSRAAGDTGDGGGPACGRPVGGRPAVGGAAVGRMEAGFGC